MMVPPPIVGPAGALVPPLPLLPPPIDAPPAEVSAKLYIINEGVSMTEQLVE